MSGAHLSAEELQQYILDRPGCAAGDIAHVDNCPDCQAQVTAYTLLMKELGQQPVPGFGFDVASMVLPQLVGLPVTERRAGGASERRAGERRAGRLGRWGMAALIFLVTAVPAWLFRRSAYYVFTDISAIFLYLILGAAGVFLLVRVLHLMKRYQHIINSIK